MRPPGLFCSWSWNKFQSNEQIDQLEHSSLADCGDWNRTLAQTLIPDFQPLKETALLSNGSPYQPHRPQVHSNGSVNGGPPTHQTNQPTQPQLTSGRIPQPPPDIQSSHFTISPIKHELVHVDLLEGTDFKSSRTLFFLNPSKLKMY